MSHMIKCLQYMMTQNLKSTSIILLHNIIENGYMTQNLKRSNIILMDNIIKNVYMTQKLGSKATIFIILYIYYYVNQMPK